MKKSTLEMMKNYLNGDDTVDLSTLRNEVNTEWERITEKSRANAALYDSARDVVMAANGWDEPMYAKDIWEIVKDAMPTGFSLSKMQYAFREKWADLIQRHNPENIRDPYKYSRR